MIIEVHYCNTCLLCWHGNGPHEHNITDNVFTSLEQPVTSLTST